MQKHFCTFKAKIATPILALNLKNFIMKKLFFFLFMLGILSACKTTQKSVETHGFSIEDTFPLDTGTVERQYENGISIKLGISIKTYNTYPEIEYNYNGPKSVILTGTYNEQYQYCDINYATAEITTELREIAEKTAVKIPRPDVHIELFFVNKEHDLEFTVTTYWYKDYWNIQHSITNIDYCKHGGAITFKFDKISGL